MRSNLPVTNIEYVLREGESPTSKTDIHGNITYVNQDFVNISGFSEAELIGQPQNIVRHPDMPEEAFADLWRTIKSGKPWTGLVKNRCKNGDHYWVEANVAPIIQDGAPVGYTSVRGKPSREQVQAAEAAYRLIRSGDKSLEVREGSAVKPSRFRFGHVSFKTRMVVAATMVGAMFGAIGLLAWLVRSGNVAYLDWLIAVSVAGLPAAAMAGYLSYRSVVVPLRFTRRELDRISAGDLTGRISSCGIAEFHDLMDSSRVLQTNFKWVIAQIQETAHALASGSGEIASGNADLSARTESQASSLEESASSIEELTGTVKQTAENAHDASHMVVSTSQLALDGGQVVARVVETMTSIQDSSRRIGDIIGMIDGIAFQTNILALNAAVEAARAGDHGRGFAVVATEVRSLAQRSADAAKEIKTLIADSVQSVKEGSRLVDETRETMDNIVSSVQIVADIVRGIADASREQSIGIEQVNQAVGQMDEITQQNGALVEQVASSSDSLQKEAIRLEELVAHFRTGRPDGAHSAHHAPVRQRALPVRQANASHSRHRSLRRAA